MTIKILVTGRTFDKEYDPLTGQLYFKEMHIPEMLRLRRSQLYSHIKRILMIDSLNMTEADRKKILRECQTPLEDKILITHRTDTMTKTAKLLGQHIKDTIIIVTWAMITYALGSSNGLFNLGSAFAFFRHSPQGVYIIMKGKYFYWNNVGKNKDVGLFEEIQ